MIVDLIMVLPYVMLCTLIIFLNTKWTNSRFNALNVYMVIWPLMVAFYQLKFIKYYDLTIVTWVIIYLSTIVVAIGYYIGNHLKLSQESYERENNDELLRRKLKNLIVIFSILSLIAIIPNTLALMNRYGVNVLAATEEIYYDNLNGVAPQTIPYLGYFAQAGAVLAGIYFAKFSFKKFLIFPVLLSVVNVLPSGSRGNIIITALLVLIPSFLVSKKVKISRKSKFIIIVSIILLITLFIVLTINRSQNIDARTMSVLNDHMASFASRYPAVYKLYQYFASPVGVLNEYLKNPEYAFGANTFLTVYSLLNKKFGIHINYNRYQKFYYIPLRTNVGTWIRELIMDFSVVGMFIVIFVFSVIVGGVDKKAKTNNKIKDLYLATILDTMLIMSFFVWYLREGSMVVLLLIYFIVSIAEDIKIIFRKNTTLMPGVSNGK